LSDFCFFCLSQSNMAISCKEIKNRPLDRQSLDRAQRLFDGGFLALPAIPVAAADSAHGAESESWGDPLACQTEKIKAFATSEHSWFARGERVARTPRTSRRIPWCW